MRLLFILFALFSCALPAVSAMADNRAENGTENATNNHVLAIIIAPENVTTSMTKSELALIYWRKKLFWSSGLRIQPVNFSANNPLRIGFSKHVLHSLPETQTDYWNGLYYHGVSPPHVVESSEAAIRFVTETKGGIAYVPACTVDDRVKTLAWLDDDGQLSDKAPRCIR